jgi:hypothetical protein
MANKPPKPSHGPVVAVRVPVTGRAGRDRSTRAGYLAKAQHQMLLAYWRHSPTANTISRRGPGQQAITRDLLGSATAVRDIDALIPERAVSPAAPPPPGSLPACSRRSYLAAVLGNGGRRGCRPAHYRVPEGRHATRIESHRSASPDGPQAGDRTCPRPLPGAADLPRRAGGQLMTAPQDRLCQAITCTLRYWGQRTLIDDDVTDDMLGQRRVAASQQRLPVQRSGVTAVKVGVPAAG